MSELIRRKTFNALYKNMTVYRVGYCGIQNILEYRQPRYYTARAEGWACDIFFVAPPRGETVAITTGYCPFGEGIQYPLYYPLDKIAKKFKDYPDILDMILYKLIECAEKGIKELSPALLKEFEKDCQECAEKGLLI